MGPCSSGSSKGSHVLTAIDPESSRPGVRFSFSKYNTKEDIDFAIDQLKELVKLFIFLSLFQGIHKQ